MNELAARQHGIVTRAQLCGIGLTPRMVQRRLEQQRLCQVHRGVYRVGPSIAEHSAQMAAVLACGAGAILSHWSAAALWELLRPGTGHTEIDVTVQGRDGGRRPGIRARRKSPISRAEHTTWNGIPVTTPARTLFDIAGDAAREGRARDLEQAVAEAERRGLATLTELLSLIDRYPRRRGVALLRSIVDSDGGPALTRSVAEERVLALIRRARLPAPEVNAFVAGYEVDFVWRAARLVVEVDGFAFHSARSSFEGDRRRDADIAATGMRVLRVTWRQVTQEPEAVLGRIALLLGQAGAA